MTDHLAFVCTARRSYTRNEVIVAALQQHFPVRIVASDQKTYPKRLLAVGPGAVDQILNADIVVAGFLSQPLAPILQLRQVQKPVIADMFISLHETLCQDRRHVKPGSLLAKTARSLDQTVLRRADRVLTDTRENAKDLARRYDVGLDKFVAVYVGANESLFYPRNAGRANGFHVFYYSTYLPLHGVDIIIRAARLLDTEPDLHVHLLGDGPERPYAERLAGKIGTRNVSFHNPVPYGELPDYIAEADICLGGHFNALNAKARRVVPGKVFQFLAMGKPTVVGDCPGNREALREDRDAIFVPMSNPEALAEAILNLRRNPLHREHIAQGGLERFRSHYTVKAIADQLKQAIDSVKEGAGNHGAIAA